MIPVKNFLLDISVFMVKNNILYRIKALILARVAAPT